MFLMFQFQGFLIAVLSLPIVMIAINNRTSLSFYEIFGTIICLTGFIGESTADQQLKDFTSDASNKNKTCSVGLWNYSRHPNYFFEWVVWMGIFFMSLGCSYSIIFIYCPLIMLFLLTQVSGIKLSEQYSVKNRIDYKLYQKTTSAFVPWLKKGL